MKEKLIVFTFPFSPMLSVIRDGCELPNVEFIVIEDNRNILVRILSVVFLFFKMYSLALLCMTNKEKYNEIRKICKNSDQSFLFWSSDYTKHWITISKLFNAKAKYCFSWGPIEESAHLSRKLFFINKAKKMGIRFFTMNPFDAKKYDMVLTSQVYRKKWNFAQSVENSDFFFLGKTKGRDIVLKRLEEILKTKQYKVNFQLYEDLPKQFVTFEEYIKQTVSCRCIVDVVAKKYNQNGLTLRPLEALFFKKKLLTTCKELKKYDFYHPDNIFTIDFDEPSLDGIDEFMKKPFREIDEKIIDQYDVNHWLKRYFMDGVN